MRDAAKDATRNATTANALHVMDVPLATHVPMANALPAMQSPHTATATESLRTVEQRATEITRAAERRHDATVQAATIETIEKNNIEYHEYIAFR